MAGIAPGEFGKADDARRRGKMRLDVPRAFFGVPRKDGDGRFGCVVPVFHAGRFRLFPVFEQAHDRLVNGDLSQNVLERFERQSARTKKARRLTGEIDDRGLHAHAAGPAVKNRVDFAVHVLAHVLHARGARPPGGVSGGRGDGNAGFLDNGERYRVIGAAHTDRLEPSCRAKRDNGLSRQDHRQGSRPEALRQPVSCLRHALAVPLQPRRIRHMDNERIVLRAALRLKDVQHCFFIQRVRAESIDRLRRNAEESSRADNVCRPRNILRRERFKINGVHGYSFLLCE